MTVSEILEKMIEGSRGDVHQIAHFVKVWAYAKTIGELEGLDSRTQEITEISAVIHDIAIPLCKEKYGKADGYLQEQESEPLVRTFLGEAGCDSELIERAVLLVTHHHSYVPVLGTDHQILLEADYLVNAEENRDSKEKVQRAYDQFFRTEAGRRMLKALFAI